MTARAAFQEEHKWLQCRGLRAQRRHSQGGQQWPGVARRRKLACWRGSAKQGATGDEVTASQGQGLRALRAGRQCRLIPGQ